MASKFSDKQLFQMDKKLLKLKHWLQFATEAFGEGTQFTTSTPMRDIVEKHGAQVAFVSLFPQTGICTTVFWCGLNKGLYVYMTSLTDNTTEETYCVIWKPWTHESADGCCKGLSVLTLNAQEATSLDDLVARVLGSRTVYKTPMMLN